MSCNANCNDRTTGRCVISCRGQKYSAGRRTMRLSAEAADRLAQAVLNPTEVGGVLEPDFKNGVLTVKHETKGGKDSVEIPIGVFQFHTHPNACRSASSCYFEFPSENDMVLIARDSMKGLVAHFIVTLERVYRVAISPKLRLRFAQDPDKVEDVFDHFADLMMRLQERAQTEGVHIMPELLKEWVREATSYGFLVTIFKDPRAIQEIVEAI